MSVTTTQLSPEIGVEITGVHDRAFVDERVAAECQAALDAHGVVVYREAHIDDDDLIAFSRLLGPVHQRPQEHRLESAGALDRQPRPEPELGGRRPARHVCLAHRRHDGGVSAQGDAAHVSRGFK